MLAPASKELTRLIAHRSHLHHPRSRILASAPNAYATADDVADHRDDGSPEPPRPFAGMPPRCDSQGLALPLPSQIQFARHNEKSLAPSLYERGQTPDLASGMLPPRQRAPLLRNSAKDFALS